MASAGVVVENESGVEGSHVGPAKNVVGGEAEWLDQEWQQQRAVERSNLLNLTKLVVKSLIETSMRSGQALHDNSAPLRQLFVILEQVIKHRLKVKRNLLGQSRSFWGMVETFERSGSASSDFTETIASVRSIVGIKTMVGRGRAWLRISLMTKRLADHFRTITENKTTLSECYEQDALMMCDSMVVISGLLMGLNVIDYTVMMNGEDFDKTPGVLDLSQFLRLGNYLEKPPPTEEAEEDDDQLEDRTSTQLSQLLDQKAFLEELNKKLQSQVQQLLSRQQSVEEENGSIREQLAELISSVESVTSERDQAKEERDRAASELQKRLETVHDDQKTELSTYIQSRAGLNDLYEASQKSLDSEMKLRQQLEQEIQLMRGLKEEKETALQLLEKSVHEKQDSLVTLRKQLDELKGANLKMKSQLKTSKETHQTDSLKIKSLENQVSQLTSKNQQLQNQLQQAQVSLRESEKTSRDLAVRLEEVQLARSTAESDLSIEKQWRASLQMELQREKDRIVELTNQTKKFKAFKQEHAELQEKYACLQESVSEQEIALVEMGRQLSLAQEKLAEMKQESQIMKESVWKDDKDVSKCQSCQAGFSVARRKHHCRNCGGVFCGNCSDNTMQLASSAKPVRVCDTCYTLLLERSSS